MVGGSGNDTYYVDNLSDVITEGAGEGVQDWVYASVSGYTMAANVEVGVVNIASGGRIDGNGGDNVLFGSDAADQLYGLGGNDAFGAGAGNDVIDGGAGNDAIGAGAGDDTITGGLGDDTLYGQGGNNLFVMTGTTNADTIIDFVAGAGLGDRVQLLGYDSFSNFSDVQAAMTMSGGSAVLDLGGGNQITFANVAPAQFAADDFLFT